MSSPKHLNFMKHFLHLLMLHCANVLEPSAAVCIANDQNVTIAQTHFEQVEPVRAPSCWLQQLTLM